MLSRIGALTIAGAPARASERKRRCRSPGGLLERRRPGRRRQCRFRIQIKGPSLATTGTLVVAADDDQSSRRARRTPPSPRRSTGRCTSTPATRGPRCCSATRSSSRRRTARGACADRPGQRRASGQPSRRFRPSDSHQPQRGAAAPAQKHEGAFAGWRTTRKQPRCHGGSSRSPTGGC
jgi:hypothetical protein